MKQIAKSVWRYHDAFGSTSYLVVGKERAAMIDCGMSAVPVMPMIREITQLPVDLLLTHAHPDHYGAAVEFERIWMHEADIEALGEMEPVFAGMGVAPLPQEKLCAFSDGHVFDLGGAQLLAAELTGHTPGSSVFVYEAEEMIFSGDAVGSGDIVLMAVPQAYDLGRYACSLREFLSRSAAWDGFSWHAGHWHQAERGEGQERNDPCRELIEDMAALCDMILEGRVTGEEVQEPFAPRGQARRAYHGRAGIVYCDHQLVKRLT